MTLFPAASAGPTLWQTRWRGKLKGLIPTTTPQGTRIVNPNLFTAPGAPSSGTTSLERRFASSEESAMISTARDTSTRASPMIFPSSRVIVRARSSLRWVMRSAALRRMRYRS